MRHFSTCEFLFHGRNSIVSAPHYNMVGAIILIAQNLHILRIAQSRILHPDTLCVSPHVNLYAISHFRHKRILEVHQVSVASFQPFLPHHIKGCSCSFSLHSIPPCTSHLILPVLIFVCSSSFCVM